MSYHPYAQTNYWAVDLNCGCEVSLDAEPSRYDEPVPCGGKITKPCRLHDIGPWAAEQMRRGMEGLPNV